MDGSDLQPGDEVLVPGVIVDTLAEHITVQFHDGSNVVFKMKDLVYRTEDNDLLFAKGEEVDVNEEGEQ